LIIQVLEFIVLLFITKKVNLILKIIENNKYYLRAYRDKQSSVLSMLLIKLDDEYVRIKFFNCL